MISIVTNIEEINRLEWSNFVLNHPQGNIFQTPEMYDLYKVTNNYTPIVFVAIKDSKIVGVLLATIIVNGKSVINFLTKRSIITGGPIVKENNIEIESLPGPCACVTAMTLCGLDSKRFMFYGFL